MRKFFALVLKMFGWSYSLPVEIPAKCVVCVAPHTSNWDYPVGMLFYRAVIGKPHVLMKKELFFFPFNYIFKSMGGFPVDRKKRSSIAEQMVEAFKTRNHFQLAISPEGTRKRNANWKTGFYHIAYNAGVPIVVAYIDYSKKEVGVKAIFHPTGDMQREIEEIKGYYQGVGAKYPEKFAIK